MSLAHAAMRSRLNDKYKHVKTVAPFKTEAQASQAICHAGNYHYRAKLWVFVSVLPLLATNSLSHFILTAEQAKTNLLLKSHTNTPVTPQMRHNPKMTFNLLLNFPNTSSIVKVQMF